MEQETSRKERLQARMSVEETEAQEAAHLQFIKETQQGNARQTNDKVAAKKLTRAQGTKAREAKKQAK
jgi:hypothetical protein